jgi:uncharacterized RDD family membrane protein YckC
MSSTPRSPSPPATGTTYAGQRLGLPERGRGSVAGWGRRFLALGVDWIASLLVAATFAGPAVFSSHGWEAWVPMLVFFVEAGVLTPLVGGSFGQLLTRVAVVRLDGRPLNLLLGLARAALVCLVVPPLIFNRDQRGLHDLLAGTVTVRR